MPTPHNNAKIGEIAKTVLMPGDPLRAKYIADTFLDDAKLVTDIRNIYAFTGTYKGVPVTIMASGMGMPSMGIYSYELYRDYGVENIIRIGSAGSYCERLRLYDVVLAESAWSESTFAETQNGCKDHVLYPDASLNEVIALAGKEQGIDVKAAKVHSTDVFYTEPTVDGFKEINAKYGCECVEMESFALFHNASVFGKKAACLITISDCFVSDEKATVEERQTSFTNMMNVALEAAAKLGK